MSKEITVRPVELPQNALVSTAMERVDYADAFCAQLPEGTDAEVTTLARHFFERRPLWVDRALRARDKVAGLIGLKTAPLDVVVPTLSFEPGAKVALFQVFARNEREIVVGANDRHLDFRLSFIVEDGHRVTATTTVKFNGLLGRWYFAVVKPFHKHIVPAMLRAALAK